MKEKRRKKKKKIMTRSQECVPVEGKKKKKDVVVVVSCFGDSATHFHLKATDCFCWPALKFRLLKKITKNKKWRASKKFVLASSERKKKTRGLSISSFVNSWVLFDLIHWQAPKIVEWSQVRFFPPFQRSDNKNKSPIQYQRHSGRGRKERGEKYKK